jgi:tetratricopeptide (TPR) repeat protein
MAAYRESLEASKRAVELNPNLATGSYNAAAVLRVMGRHDESLKWNLRALGVDPKNAIAAAGMGVVYDVLGDSEQAERWLNKSAELLPDLGQARAYRIFFSLRRNRDEEALKLARAVGTFLPNDLSALHGAAIAELVTGQLQDAQRRLEQILSAFRATRGVRDYGAGVETNLAYVRLRAGRRAEAEALLEESLATDRSEAAQGNQDWGIPYDIASVHALRGEKDEAFRYLDKAIEAGWRGWPIGLRDPLLDSLRSDPRLKQIDARIAALVAEMRSRAGLH